MKDRQLFWIKLPYYLGIAADALWGIAILFPQVFISLTGRPEMEFDFQTRQIMAIGGILLIGWTCLLIWGVIKPMERRMVILLTAFPVVFGLFLVALSGYLNGNTFNLWILIKTFILFCTMLTSYILATKYEKAS